MSLAMLLFFRVRRPDTSTLLPQSEPVAKAVLNQIDTTPFVRHPLSRRGATVGYSYLTGLNLCTRSPLKTSPV